MTTAESRPPVAPGEPAPDFTLPAVDRKETVSLADYRGRSPVFLALFIGLWCPFCRRADRADGGHRGQAQGARRGDARGRGHAAGKRAALLQVPPDSPAPGRRPRAPHPPRVRLAEACPDPGDDAGDETVRINPTGEFPEPLPIPEAAKAIQLDGYAETETDQADMQQQWPQLKGQFLIDRDGIVRWANVECAAEGLAGIGKFPSEEEILTAARALPRR